MKRFLNNKIVTAQIADILRPAVDPNSPEGKKSTAIENLPDDQKLSVIQRSEELVKSIIDNRSSALAIYKTNGKSEEDYNEDLEAYKSFSVNEQQFNQYITGLWPMMRAKNITFDKFLDVLTIILKRYKAPSQVDSFFKNFVESLPNLEKTLGTSDEVIDKAIDFMVSDVSGEEFQQFLIYQMILRYGLYNEIPENKTSDIIKATETLDKVRQNLTPLENKVQQYLIQQNDFLQKQNEWYEQNALVYLSMDYYNMIDIKKIFEKGIKPDDIKFYIENFKRGARFQLYLQSDPLLAPAPGTSPGSGTPVGVNRKSKTLFKREVLAALPPEDAADAAGYPKLPSTEQEDRQTESTDSSGMSRLYGKLSIQIQQFENVLQILSKTIDDNIKYIIDKQASSNAIGPFSAGLIFSYLQDEETSLAEADRAIENANMLIGNANTTLNAILVEINKFTPADGVSSAQKANAKLAIEEKYKLFVKDVRSKQLGLKFNKVVIKRQERYAKAEDEYNNLKIEMAMNELASPTIAPRAVAVGFGMADILEEIAEEFKSIAGNNPIRAEQANKSARAWQNFAKQQRANVFAEIYPKLAAAIGIGPATGKSVSTFKLSATNSTKNLRVASKFMDKEVESDQKFRDYWNHLFMQSKDPRPMGDIIEEKPIHGDLTTKEDAKHHKNTMRKFKKPTLKKSRFKKK